MRKLRAFKFRLSPKPKQELLLRRAAGCRRYVFNKGLEIQKERYEKGGKKLSYAGLCKELTSWKHQSDSAFLVAAPSQVLQQALKDLERSYENFFAGRAGFRSSRREERETVFAIPIRSK